MFRRPYSTSRSHRQVKHGQSRIHRGNAAVVRKLGGISPKLIVLEATGGLERRAVAALAGASLPVVAVNPRRSETLRKQRDSSQRRTPSMRPCWRSSLTVFVPRSGRCATRKPGARSSRGPSSPGRRHDHRREESPHRRSALEACRDRNRQDHKVVPKAARGDRQRLDNAVKGSPLWREKDDLLQSVPGVGKVLSRTLLSLVPELGTLGKKQLAALVGVAPRTGTAASSAAGARFGAAAPTSELSCTWARSSPPASIQSSVPSMPASWPPASYPRSPSSPACESYSPSSTRSSATVPHGLGNRLTRKTDALPASGERGPNCRFRGRRAAVAEAGGDAVDGEVDAAAELLGVALAGAQAASRSTWRWLSGSM